MRYQCLDPSDGGLVVRQLPKHLMRGVRFAKLMSGMGSLLRTRPDSLPLEAQEKLYDHTESVEKFSYFFSHCWSSPGHQKYIALLLYEMAHRAIWAGAISTSAVILLQRFWAPLPCYMSVDGTAGTTFCQSPWEFIVGNVVAWTVLLLGPHCVRDRAAFFDATCIPQAPVQAKLEGIRHLPSFVAACDELVIAWDAFFFTRGWCVYELAMYKALFPERRITVLPIKVYELMLACHVCNLLGGGIFLAMLPLCGNSTLPCVLCMVLTGVIAAHAGEDLDSQQRQCDKQLREFDFRNAGVQIESDRVEMERSINSLCVGGVAEFQHRVRTEIREEVLARFSSCRAMLPYSFMLIAVYPLFPFFACWLTTFAAFPAQVQVANAIAEITWPFLFLPCAIALTMKLGACCGAADVGADGPADVPWRLRHVALGLLYSAMCAAYGVVSVGLPDRVATGGRLAPIPRQRWYGALLSFAVFLISAAVAAFAFCPRRAAPSSSPRPASVVRRGSDRARPARILARL